MDVQGMGVEQCVREVEAAASFILDATLPANSLLPPVCGVQPRGSLDKSSAAWKAFQAKVAGLMKAQAVVGLTGFMRVVGRLVLRELYFASSEDDGQAWLARQ